MGRGRLSRITKVRTTCSYCGVGCNFDLNVSNNKVIRVTSATDAPVNGHATCVKGRYGYDYVHHPDRLKRPLVRAQWLDAMELAQRTENGEWRMADGDLQLPEVKPQMADRKRRKRDDLAPAHDAATHPEIQPKQSPWVEVDWPTALDVVARKFTAIKAESGGDAIAVLASAKCTSEENYLVNKLTRQVIGTNNIDHCARL